MVQLADCPCAGKSLPRLLRPGIMAFLAQGEAHGFQIAQHLSELHIFAGRDPDPPGIYRTLKEMADEGLVTSTWRMGETGPAKRVFALTQAGRSCLKTWLTTLCDFRDAIDEMVALLRRARSDVRSGPRRRHKTERG